MQIYGQGTEGRKINSLVNAAAPTFNGIAFIPEIKVVSIQTIITAFTGAFTGNWLLEASNNFAPDGQYLGQVPNAGTWVDVTASTLIVPAFTAAITANGSQLINIPNIGWRAIRITITRTGGTSVQAEAWVQGKG